MHRVEHHPHVRRTAATAATMRTMNCCDSASTRRRRSDGRVRRRAGAARWPRRAADVAHAAHAAHAAAARTRGRRRTRRARLEPPAGWKRGAAREPDHGIRRHGRRCAGAHAYRGVPADALRRLRSGGGRVSTDAQESLRRCAPPGSRWRRTRGRVHVRVRDAPAGARRGTRARGASQAQVALTTRATTRSARLTPCSASSRVLVADWKGERWEDRGAKGTAARPRPAPKRSRRRRSRSPTPPPCGSHTRRAIINEFQRSAPRTHMMHARARARPRAASLSHYAIAGHTAANAATYAARAAARAAATTTATALPMRGRLRRPG